MSSSLPNNRKRKRTNVITQSPVAKVTNWFIGSLEKIKQTFFPGQNENNQINPFQPQSSPSPKVPIEYANFLKAI